MRPPVLISVFQAPTATPTAAPVCAVDQVTVCDPTGQTDVCGQLLIMPGPPGTGTVCVPRVGQPEAPVCIPNLCCAQYVTADNTCGSDADCPCDRTCVTSICGAQGGFCAPIAGAQDVT